ncbi:hypothetical protein PVAP13_6NG250803 [Panicum virgatum]|uniref:F-box associated beta-propeller type 3 domain-containing protein n=1 Tax=Panicum virgatum TaxID=38727 RepID=A0A8T0R1V7_PANVG|nr:hypothetical protein PVAP13_6NG250803 [Panicum virgatum]
MIGTCSNLLYVQRESGEITAIDVAARLMLAGTDPPATGPSGQHESTYPFGCHPETGLHKVVHVPCHESAELDAVHVLTLEDDGFPPEWREVPAPAGSGCLLRFGLVNVGGVTYWVTKDAGRIMSFDLKDESFAVLEWPPMPVLLWMAMTTSRRATWPRCVAGWGSSSAAHTRPPRVQERPRFGCWRVRGRRNGHGSRASPWWRKGRRGARRWRCRTSPTGSTS